MMKSKKLLALLSLALTLGVTSCKDNDLSDANTGGNTSGQVTEDNYQKYEALQNLLGVVADVDSLPQNWDMSNYTAEPTIGSVVDPSQPYVRYVATASAEEADREFRSMISQGTDGTAKSTTWKQDGVGSLDFKVLNQTDCYATLDVNVQQLPHLTQVRFVPASAIGNNKEINPYYQFGDVVEQTINGKETYWVCVRPCDKTGEMGKSHWCSLQLVPKSEAKSNYKRISDNLYLPTDLCSDKGTGQRMVQNFFNVLRIMANPEIYNQNDVAANQRVGVDKIKYEDFTYEQAKIASYYWDKDGIWNLLSNAWFTSNSLTELGDDNPPSIRAYYYGYNKKWIGKGDYTTYYLDIKNDASKGFLYNVVTPQTELVYANNPINYTTYELSGSGTVTEDGNNVNKKVYIVKYRTGSDLENSWYNDKTPETGFADRLQPNNMSEKFVLKKASIKDIKDIPSGAYFAFGDLVSASKSSNCNQICVKPGQVMYGNAEGDCNDKSIFIGKEPSNDEIVNFQLSNKCKAIILYQIAAAYAHNYTDLSFPEIDGLAGDDDDDEKDEAAALLEKNKSCYVTTLTSFSSYVTLNTHFKGEVDEENGKITIQASFLNDGSYELVCYPGKDTNPTMRKLPEYLKGVQVLPLLWAKDTNGFRESYSTGGVYYGTQQGDRANFKVYFKKVVNDFLDKLTIE